MPIEEQLRGLRVVPVVRIDDAADAPALGRALAAGGLPVAEITFRTPAAPDAIRALRDACPGVLAGAGTVLSPGTVEQAVDAGAAFVVTPGFSPAVVERCLELGVPVVPGVNSPTQVELGLSYDLRLLKFFPAVASGGIPMLRALAGPYGDVSFMPTGGVTVDTAADWLALPSVAAVGGTWVATTAAITAGRFTEITELARTARAATPPHRTDAA